MVGGVWGKKWGWGDDGGELQWGGSCSGVGGGAHQQCHCGGPAEGAGSAQPLQDSGVGGEPTIVFVKIWIYSLLPGNFSWGGGGGGVRGLGAGGGGGITDLV